MPCGGDWRHQAHSILGGCQISVDELAGDMEEGTNQKSNRLTPAKRSGSKWSPKGSPATAAQAASKSPQTWRDEGSQCAGTRSFQVVL